MFLLINYEDESLTVVESELKRRKEVRPNVAYIFGCSFLQKN